MVQGGNLGMTGDKMQERRGLPATLTGRGVALSQPFSQPGFARVSKFSQPSKTFNMNQRELRAQPSGYKLEYQGQSACLLSSVLFHPVSIGSLMV